MTKPQNRSKQLPLRLLVEVSGLTPDSAAKVKEEQGTTAAGKLVLALPASENDMSVYRQISGNYFRSLRKG